VGDGVRQGDLLFRLDTERLDRQIGALAQRIERLREECAREENLGHRLASQYAATRAKSVSEIEHLEQERRGRIALAEAEWSRARQEQSRSRTLIEEGVLPRSRLEEDHLRTVQAEEKLKQARLPVNRATLDVLEKEYELRREEVELRSFSRKREWEAAQKEQVQLESEHRRHFIRAHVNGLVVSGELQVGDVVPPGRVVLTIVQQLGLRIDVAVPSRDLGGIRVGMPARIRLDAYDHQKYGTMEGTVISISPDSVVDQGQAYYLVKVSLSGSEVGRGIHRGTVKIGMTAQVEIARGEETLLTLAWRGIRGEVSP